MWHALSLVTGGMRAAVQMAGLVKVQGTGKEGQADKAGAAQVLAASW